MMQIIHTGVRVLPVVYNSINLVNSGVQIYQLVSKKGPLNEEEKIKLCMEVAMSFFQSAEIYLEIRRSGLGIIESNNAEFLKAMHVTTSGLTGVIHITKEMLATPDGKEPFDWKKVMAIFLLRVSGTTKVVASAPTYALHTQECCELLGGVADIIGGGLGLIANEKELKSAAYVIAKWTKNILCSSPKTANSLPIIPLNITNPEEVHSHFENVYAQVSDWKTMKLIPLELTTDPILKQFKCSISEECIRFAVTPQGPQGLHHGIYYETSRIELLLLEGTVPPKWPQELDFNRENVVKNDAIQTLIDIRLNSISEEWQNDRALNNREAT